MIIKYEKTTGTGDDKAVVEVEKTKATHKHICYHDEGNGRPCKREVL